MTAITASVVIYPTNQIDVKEGLDFNYKLVIKQDIKIYTSRHERRPYSETIQSQKLNSDGLNVI